MRILVPVKRVVDPFAKVRPLADGSGIDATGARSEINPFDEIALEEAVRIKEREPSVEVVAVSIGGPESEEQLRKALAIGADRAILVEALAPLDSPGVAAELASLVIELKPDVVLMGKQGTDDDSNQAGQMLAAKLGWPQATFAAKVALEESGVRVERETDTGVEALELPLPCVITADLRLNEPRYVALPGIIRARSKPLERRPQQAPQPLRTRVLRYDPAPARQPGKRVGSVEELLDELRAKGALG